jgi:uncharacterized membrane protein YozB (DUF420 family)
MAVKSLLKAFFFVSFLVETPIHAEKFMTIEASTKPKYFVVKDFVVCMLP